MAGMTTLTQSAFPATALDWLIDQPGAQVLALGRTCVPLMRMLSDRGVRLTANDPDPSGVRRMLARAPRALPTVADAVKLPFVPCAFDVIVINQSFHTHDPETVLPELARVLKPGGHLALSYTIRDDSVPWVRRLVTLMRTVDPQAMTGDYGSASVEALEGSPLFPTLERRDFRLWAPINRASMLDMVARRFPELGEDRLSELLASVAALYDDSARKPEPLLLPYRVSCWRSWVDHSELTSGLALPDDGLQITL